MKTLIGLLILILTLCSFAVSFCHFGMDDTWIGSLKTGLTAVAMILGFIFLFIVGVALIGSDNKT